MVERPILRGESPSWKNDRFSSAKLCIYKSETLYYYEKVIFGRVLLRESSSEEMSANGVKVRLHAVEDGKVGPVVTTFVQGPPAEECLTGDAKAGPFQPIDFRLSGSTDSRKRTHRQLTGTNDSLRFEAKNYGEEVQKGAAK
jgi:hypothetical protein